MKASDARVIEYDFATGTATVVFGDHQLFTVDGVVSYFEDASDGKVLVIRIFNGERLALELRRHSKDQPFRPSGDEHGLPH